MALVTRGKASSHCLVYKIHSMTELSAVVESHLLAPPKRPSLSPSSGIRGQGLLRGRPAALLHLLGDLVDSMSQVTHIARCDPCHGDAAVFSHVDGELLSQSLYLKHKQYIQVYIQGQPGSMGRSSPI